MGILIAMTDFILEKEDQFNTGEIGFREFTNYVCNYANLLKQKLELRMFVPCKLIEGVWVVLAEPNSRLFNMIDGSYEKAKREYQEAKERCLFEGFESKETRADKRICLLLSGKYRINNIDSIENDEYGLFFYDSRMEKSRLHIIEDLLKFNILQLTPTAKNIFNGFNQTSFRT